MTNHMITGGGGVQLHVVETGNATGRPILFIHGFSQCGLAWSRQMDSDLADDHRLIAMDLRGHGLSDKPREGYGDSKLWADDVRAVIEALGLDHPVLCGWSYGPVVILDYIRHYGEEGISGLNFVGAVTKLGTERALSVFTPEVLSLVPGFFSTGVEESVGSLASLIQMFFVQEPFAEEQYLMLGYNCPFRPMSARRCSLARSTMTIF
jgi:non-heme chloroperoxidase